MDKNNKNSKQVQCLECRNDISLETEDVRSGYFFECPFCGITMEVKEIKPDGSLHVIIVELEK